MYDHCQTGPARRTTTRRSPLSALAMLTAVALGSLPAYGDAPVEHHAVDPVHDRTTATVTLATVTAPTATVVTGTVTITPAPDGAYRVEVDYGDGRTDTFTHDGPATCAFTPDVTVLEDFAHAWRKPGGWPVRVTVTVPSCPPGQDVAVAATGLAITPGATPVNGPLPPEARLWPVGVPLPPENHPAPEPTARPAETYRVPAIPWAPPSRGRFTLRLRDRDGWVTTALIRWGDGTTTRIAGADLRRCADPAPRLAWPTRTDELVLTHRFRAGRSYATTVTVESVGCDGKDRSSATYTLRHQAR